MKLFIYSILVAVASALKKDLTTSGFDDDIAGKGAFVMFMAPWCGHCKKLKPDWGLLGDEFESNPNVVIGMVDCTVEKDLCSRFGVRGYPTLKSFSSSSSAEGDSYEGARTLDALKTYASENLGPSCSAENKDLCDEAQLKELEAALAMPAEERDTKIKEGEDALKAAEQHFKAEVDKLQKKYQELQAEKDSKKAEISKPMKWLRMAAAAPASEGKEEL